jgi:hypothetical protein
MPPMTIVSLRLGRGGAQRGGANIDKEEGETYMIFIYMHLPPYDDYPMMLIILCTLYLVFIFFFTYMILYYRLLFMMGKYLIILF